MPKNAIVKLGVEFACFDYYKNIILQNGDIFINYLVDDYWGLDLFNKSIKFRDAFTIFNHFFPKEIILCNLYEEKVYLSSFIWLGDLIEEYAGLNEKETLAFLGINYFRNLLKRINLKNENIDNEKLYALYMQSKYIPEIMKNDYVKLMLTDKAKIKKKIK